MAGTPRVELRGRYRWSLRLRLLAVVLLALLPIAALLAFLWHGARERDRDDALGNLTQTVEAVAVIADTVFDEGITLGEAIATDPAVQTLDPIRFLPRLREISARAPHNTNIVVVDSKGAILGWTAPEPLPAHASVADRPFIARVTSTGQATTVHVVNDNGPYAFGTGVAVPIVSTDGVLVGVVLAGALVASRALIAPLRRLAEHAGRLGDGHFERIDHAVPDSEIGDLAVSFNVMGERLQRTIEDLRHERTRLATTLHYLPVGVVIRAAPSGELILGNALAEQIWRHPFVVGDELNASSAC